MNLWKNIFLFLTLIFAAILLAIIKLPDSNLHIVACDVGQGDAILIYQGNTQILIDSGPDSSVMSCLSSHLPFWDRTLEVAILTHPEKDHYSGFIDITYSFKIEKFIYSSLENSSQRFQLLKDKLQIKAGELIQADEDRDIKVGMIYLDIVHPDADYKDFWDADNLNSNSVVFALKYRNFEALFTGDITPEAIQKLLLLQNFSEMDYIKIPHHGSRNGLTEHLLKATKPEVAVISVGKNSFGHPHQEILDMLKAYNMIVFRTDEMGDVHVVTDGEKYWRL